MLVPFLIMLREGIEAALIVGIIASYLKQTGRGEWMPAVWIGVFLAAALSLFVGGGLELMSAEFPQKQQELFEGIVGLIAVGILSSMVFWMRKVARSIKHALHESLDAALTGSKNQTYALIAMVFFAVAREGLETVFFLLAVFQQSEGSGAPLGALLGLLLAVGFGVAIYSGSMRLNLSLFSAGPGCLFWWWPRAFSLIPFRRCMKPESGIICRKWFSTSAHCCRWTGLPARYWLACSVTRTLRPSAP